MPGVSVVFVPVRNLGFCFINFECEEDAEDAIRKLHGREVSPGKTLSVGLAFKDKWLASF